MTVLANSPLSDHTAVGAFVALLGHRAWATRAAEIAAQAAAGSRAGQALRERQCIPLVIEQILRSRGRAIPAIGRTVADLAAQAVAMFRQLSPVGRARFGATLHAAMQGDATLIPMFHLLRTATMHRAHGFAVRFAGLEDGAPFDLLLSRAGSEVEVVCDVVSAEEGRPLHRGAWLQLADRVEPDLRTWLATHRGRFLLKITLPDGLRAAEDDALTALQQRIRAMLEAGHRLEHSHAGVLRLDPLLFAASPWTEPGLIAFLRREFGPEAHLSVTSADDAVFVMAARAGHENEIAAAVRRRMTAIAPSRLTGTRPGILAMFVDDVDRGEWHTLRARVELESEARRFLLEPLAAHVVAVTCASRSELFGTPGADAVSGHEARFRNPAHPAARIAALAPAILSSM